MLYVLLVTLSVVLFFYSWITKRPKNYPPGPPCLPVVGCAPFVTGANFHFLMEKWRDVYGPVVGLVLGSLPAVAVVEAKAVMEVLRHDDFQGRPDVVGIRDGSFGERLGVFFTDGPYWVEQRRFALRHLKEFGFGKKSMEGLIMEEAEMILKELKGYKCEPIQVSLLFAVSVVNVLWSVMSGTRYKRDDAEFQSLLERLNFSFRSGNTSGSSFDQLVPRLRFLSPHWRKIQRNRHSLQEFFRKSIREHEKTIDADNPRDFIDVYVREMQQGKPGSTFTEKSLITVCNDLFSAGAESVSNSLGFCLLYMVLHPGVQQRVHQELDAVVGRDRKPSLDDRANLAYVEATLLEVMRCNPVAPLAVPHTASKNTTFRGYDIPQGTMLLISLWSCLQDEAHWGDPKVFRPERFINAEGKLIRDAFMMNFGIGKRVCIGEALARNTLFLFFTTMMQELSFSLPPGADPPSTIPLSGFTVAPRPFEVIANERE